MTSSSRHISGIVGSSNYSTESDPLIPSCADICRIQLFRTTLVRLLSLEENVIYEFCTGCFVRVLLELNDGDIVERSPSGVSTNDYHCAVLRGVRRLDEYDGFTWDKTRTDLHFDIELPPSIRPAGHSNFVQLNSISNSPIQEHEYVQWVNRMRQSNALICTPSQIDLRLSVLTQHMRTYLRAHESKGKRQRGKSISDKSSTSRITAAREDILARLRERHTFFPHSGEISAFTKEALCTLEGELQRELERIRRAIKEKEKCVLCRVRSSAAIFYPCRHLVACIECARGVVTCPVAQCGMQVLDVIEPFMG
ncbi:hypothetical protein XU18_0421 [Perkinsela sp. CCAP 1560/4]|nr:hypothetical protein XU18_0421 [Perkinsela sp. CCAP 1560/4]|eukprot:KNH09736.1 hypothetical protein XU18_0421 [Perkinsela sp. CCAP 1560/4]